MAPKSKSIAERFLDHEFSSSFDEDWDSPTDETSSLEDEGEIGKEVAKATQEIENMVKWKLSMPISDDDEEEGGIGHRMKRRHSKHEKKAEKAKARASNTPHALLSKSPPPILSSDSVEI